MGVASGGLKRLRNSQFELQSYVQKHYIREAAWGRLEFEGFEWDAGNIAKCQKHGLSLAEIEDVFSRRVLIVNDEANSEAEQRFRAIGVTSSGRRAFIVFTLRRKRLRPLSARYMRRKEIDRYEKDNSDL